MTDAIAKTQLVPRLDTWTKNFSQDADCCDGDGPLQFLTIEQDDGGGGPFWIISTERWAFESIDDLARVLREAGVPEVAP